MNCSCPVIDGPPRDRDRRPLSAGTGHATIRTLPGRVLSQ
jgi:hypothetical protein